MNKSVLILGAKSDIAKELGKIFAKDGYDLYLAARNVNELDEYITDLKIKNNIQIQKIEFDITKIETHTEIWENIKEKIFGVILAAGYLPNQKEAEKNWNITLNTINVNYTGAVSFLNLVANSFEERKSGFIIGISSVAGDRGRKDNYIYGSTKAALTAYLSGLRARLFNSNVHVMTVKPGPVYTKMTEGLVLNPNITAIPEKVAKDIYGACLNKKDVIYTPAFWYIIMFITKHIPEFIFKKMTIR